MKISIGSKIVEGPFGGGNEFIKNLMKFLKDQDHKIITHLNDPDIDIILLTNPLLSSETSTFNNYDIDYYLKFVNSNAIVVQRINECDERKNTSHINSAIAKFNKSVDINIYVSDWLKTVYSQFDMINKTSFVIKGGPDEKIFSNANKVFWDKKLPLKIVTHHWSSNWMKGFKVYKKIDDMLEDKIFKDKITFTYIGNVPKNISFKNTTVIEPKSGVQLADEIKKYDVHITGSINEPSGNHHMEAALCGLPILYHDSGALKEYCEDYGILYSFDNIDNYIEKIIESYDEIVSELRGYPYTFTNAANEFLKIFVYAQKNKSKFINQRKKNSYFIVLYYYFLNIIKKYLYTKFKNLKVNLGKFKRFILR